jgi:Fic family protein
VFYLSEYLEVNRQEYYDRLLAVSSKDDWTGWCEFFLRALVEQAGENEAKTRRILELYRKKKEVMVEATHSQYAIAALDFLFRQPVFSSSRFLAESRIPAPTARRILNLCHDNGFLKEIRKASGRRPAIFAFPELVNVAEGRSVL